jgi:hypothetical protein
MGPLQRGDGLGGGFGRRIGAVEAGRLDVDAEPAGVPLGPVAADEVPQAPGDRREGLDLGPGGEVAPERPGGGRPQGPAVLDRLPEVLLVARPLQPGSRPLVDVGGESGPAGS